jgi:predicted RecB family endonuclease
MCYNEFRGDYMIGNFKVSNISEIDFMDGHIFELFCAELLRKNGFVEVYVTKGSGDQGVDVLASKDGVKYAIQCKNYSTALGNTPIQEAYAGKTYYNCHVAVVMTNSNFTPKAKDLASSTGVLLWDREIVSNMIDLAITLNAKKEAEDKRGFFRKNNEVCSENSDKKYSNANKDALRNKHFSLKVDSEKNQQVTDCSKSIKKPKCKVRKSMKVWAIICFILAMLYVWTSLIVEPFTIAGTIFFGILSIMFLLLGLTPKETKFLLNSRIKKSYFVIICIVTAFILFGTIAFCLQNNL